MRPVLESIFAKILAETSRHSSSHQREAVPVRLVQQLLQYFRQFESSHSFNPRQAEAVRVHRLRLCFGDVERSKAAHDSSHRRAKLSVSSLREKVRSLFDSQEPRASSHRRATAQMQPMPCGLYKVALIATARAQATLLALFV